MPLVTNMFRSLSLYRPVKESLVAWLGKACGSRSQRCAFQLLYHGLRECTYGNTRTYFDRSLSYHLIRPLQLKIYTLTNTSEGSGWHCPLEDSFLFLCGHVVCHFN